MDLAGEKIGERSGRRGVAGVLSSYFIILFLFDRQCVG